MKSVEDVIHIIWIITLLFIGGLLMLIPKENSVNYENAKSIYVDCLIEMNPNANREELVKVAEDSLKEYKGSKSKQAQDNAQKFLIILKSNDKKFEKKDLDGFLKIKDQELTRFHFMPVIMH